MRKNISYTGDIYKDIEREIKFSKEWIAKRTADEMYKQLSKAYKSIIAEFYSRPPKSKRPYLRHGVSMAEEMNGKGKNLYLAADNKSTLQPSPTSYDGSLYFDPTNMSSDRYRVDKGNPENVLKAILGYESNVAYRFPPIVSHKESDNQTFMTFRAHYGGFEGTPIEVLEQYRDSIADNIFNDSVKEARKQLSFKYITID